MISKNWYSPSVRLSSKAPAAHCGTNKRPADIATDDSDELVEFELWESLIIDEVSWSAAITSSTYRYLS